MKNQAKDMLNDWLRPVEVTPNPEANATREKVIKKFLTQKDFNFWLNIVRTAAGLPNDLEDSEFVGQFKKADDSFPLVNNEHLVKILANITICFKLESGDSDMNHMIALAIVNSKFINPPQFEAHIPVADYAVENIEIHAGNKRLVDIDQLHQAVAVLENQKEEESKPTSHVLADLYKLNIKLLEEVNILWWLYTGYSPLEQRPYTQIDAKSTALIAARELYELMHIERSLETAPHFFTKILADTASSQLDAYSAINALTEETKKNLIKDLEDSISEFTPIAKAITIALGVSEGDDWSGAFKKQLGGDIKKQVITREIAQQFYRELIFLKIAQE